MPATLITGSSGLIGSEAAQYYCRRGHLVIGIDNDMRREFFGQDASTRWKREALVREYAQYVHYDVDVRDRQAVERVPGVRPGDRPGRSRHRAAIARLGGAFGMGASSFRIVKVAPGYFGALMRTIWRVWRGQRDFSKPPASLHPAGDPVDVAR
jgi:hypothetical protein